MGTPAPGMPPVQHDIDPVPTSESRGAVSTPDERDELDRIERLLADEELLAALADEHFAGPRWETFSNDLAKYALPVMRAWIRTGRIFALLDARGLGKNPTEVDRRKMESDRDYREDLACETVANAIQKFQPTLSQGRWRRDGGASITTHFMGACVFAFANVFRRQQGQDQRWLQQDSNLVVDQRLMASPSSPEGDALASLQLEESRRQMKIRERQVLELRLMGYTFDEIGEIVGGMSARAVEGVVYRWRQREKARRRSEGATR